MFTFPPPRSLDRWSSPHALVGRIKYAERMSARNWSSLTRLHHHLRRRAVHIFLEALGESVSSCHPSFMLFQNSVWCLDLITNLPKTLQRLCLRRLNNEYNDANSSTGVVGRRQVAMVP